MPMINIQDALGRIIRVLVSDEVYAFWEQARKSEETRARYDRASLDKAELSDATTANALHPEEPLSDTVERTILIEQTLASIGKLGDFDRLLIHMHFYDGLTYTAIAKETGLTPQGIRQRINRVISWLAKQMGR